MLEPAWRDVWGGAVHPADPATSGFTNLRKAIVLLTDGEDTYCGIDHKPECADSPVAVSRTEACTAAKARGTEIFVIAAMPPTSVSSELARTLRRCSSESDSEYPAGTRRPDVNYVFINNATPENLEAAFGNIARQLRTLRRVY